MNWKGRVSANADGTYVAVLAAPVDDQDEGGLQRQVRVTRATEAEAEAAVKVAADGMAANPAGKVITHTTVAVGP